MTGLLAIFAAQVLDPLRLLAAVAIVIAYSLGSNALQKMFFGAVAFILASIAFTALYAPPAFAAATGVAAQFVLIGVVIVLRRAVKWALPTL